MPRRVLVADDEPITAELLAVMLSFRGYDVLCAHDGAEALALARAHRPDAILLDALMPRLEGVEVAKAVRRDEELRSTPIVLFSSCDECDVDWRDAGANTFLRKPIDVVGLPDLVGRLLGDDPPPVGDRLAA